MTSAADDSHDRVQRIIGIDKNNYNADEDIKNKKMRVFEYDRDIKKDAIQMNFIEGSGRCTPTLFVTSTGSRTFAPRGVHCFMLIILGIKYIQEKKKTYFHSVFIETFLFYVLFSWMV